MIEFNEVGYKYAGDASEARQALTSVDLVVAPGELVAVLGPNGSGKSTLALLSNGLLLPDAGDVLVDGLRTDDADSAWSIRSRVGVVFQDPDNQIVATTVEEDVAFGPENLGVPQAELRFRVDRALELVGLSGLERREPHTLSGGQKQRLAIAGVLALEPVYLVLDEPTALLDPVGRADVLAIIATLREQGHGVVHITHDIEDVSGADRVVVLGAGEVAFSGTPSEFLGLEGGPTVLGITDAPVRLLAAELVRRGLSVPPDVLRAEDLAEALWL